MNSRRHSRLRKLQYERWVRCWHAQKRECSCNTCRLHRQDLRRALAAGWDGAGSVAPFLIALDKAQAEPICEQCGQVCMPMLAITCERPLCPLRDGDEAAEFNDLIPTTERT